MQQIQNMNNQMQINLNSNMDLQNQFKESSKLPIHIIFKNEGPGVATVMVNCYPDDKLSDVIGQYRIKANDRDMNTKFIFEAHVLNLTLTVAEAGLTEYAKVFVIPSKDIKGG